ncbi:MAG: hypothetical protein AB1500_10745 [Bacillota bacterium]
MLDRIVEAYIGEYASGKSECAINRALELARLRRIEVFSRIRRALKTRRGVLGPKGNRSITGLSPPVSKKRRFFPASKVNLVDLDVVEPFWTLRPLKKEIEALGITVIAWDREDAEGLGEAGTVLKPAARWALAREGDVVLDVGYGVGGARVLEIIEGYAENTDLKVLAVINASRPMTATVQDIVDHVRFLGRVDGLVNNTHLGEETDTAVVQEGAKIVTEAARILGVPVTATTALDGIAASIGSRDCEGNPVRFLRRFMPRGFW